MEQYGGTGRRLERRGRRQPFVEPGFAGRERKVAGDVKVWQPGSHLSEARGGEVRDWSWKRTRRRIGLLVRLALPYRVRTALSLGTLLAYTVVALAPPYLAKLAIDQGIKEQNLSRLTWIIAIFFHLCRGW